MGRGSATGLPEPFLALKSKVRRPGMQQGAINVSASDGGNEVVSYGWRRKHVRILGFADALVILWAMTGALMLRFGPSNGLNLDSREVESYVVITSFLSVTWWLLLGLSGSRDTTVLGYGTEEYKRVLSSSVWLFGIVSVFSYAFQFEIARGYVLIALPAGVLSLFAARFIARLYLRSQRAIGRSSASVLLVGGVHGVEHLAQALGSQPMAGYRPIAAYIPGAKAETALDPGLTLPILGVDASPESIVSAIRQCSPDAVALSSGVPLSPRAIRELGWSLADMNVKMIMAPALTDVAGPRIHTQPVAGLPLIHVSTPNLKVGQRLAKRAFDVAAASSLLIVLAPLFALVSIMIRADSPGPVLFRQVRVGAQGEKFEMFKFRSMVIDAEQRLESLRNRNEGNTVLFKLKADPRITKVGTFLRRYSIDELPQLFNVLNGTMSLVGPRPPLPNEVALYERHVHRRLIVRPGLTGLWQVSGRSLLSWDDSVRLDLYYVENWSLLGDLTILLRTVRAVIASRGAY